jgi:TolB-like protein/DNA-binding winged helix-turn-helix (wHTH) protein/Flp pilus assembly protein TadD
MTTSNSRETFRFGDFALDVQGYQLLRNGRPIRLERQPMDLLILLVERRLQLVSRAEIVDLLWGKDVFVDVDTGVHTAIRKIRQALRDPADAPVFVETVSGKGYRFIAPVEVIPSPDTLAAQETGDALSVPASSLPVVTAPETAPLATTTVLPTGAEAGSAVAITQSWRGRLIAGGLAVVGLAGLLTWVWQSAGNPGSRLTLAVLPFENLSGDPDREYLADGLAEETIVSLGHIDPERLHVIGRTSMMVYKRTTKSIAEIGRELGADYLVESSVRAESDRLRITTKLIRVRDQVQVWSESYSREPTSMLGLQQELSSAIAEQIRLRLSPDRLNALARRQTRNAEAYDLYLRGQNFANQRTPLTTKRAIEYFQRATALDPDYALAWSGLSMAYTASLFNGDAEARDVRPPAREAATQAIRADPNLAESQHALGILNWHLEWDWPAAETALRRAVALDPSFAPAHMMLGHVLSQMGRHAEAQPAMRRARELDPFFAMAHALSSQVAFQARDYPAALEHARHAIVVDPEFWIGHAMLGQVYEQLGQNDLALEALTAATRFSGHNSKPMSLRGYVLAKVGRANEARALVTTLETVSLQRYLPPYALALVQAGLGERETVFDSLEKAYTAHDVHLMFLPVDPKWDAYRADPRFEALLARCDFTRSARARAATR